MADRVAFTPGSFFESVPAGCDLYMLSHIIHDWSEEQCLTMLATTPGQERTEPEYRALLKRANFRLTRVIPTNSAVSIVDAIPA